MYEIRAQKGSFNFVLTSLGWRKAGVLGGLPPCRMDLGQAQLVAHEEANRHDFDRVFPAPEA
jgi:hypothetical protein